MNTATYIFVCPRCQGKGNYDRGACFECKRFGAMGYVQRKTRRGRPVVVTAIRDEKEGRIPWVSIYGATPAQALEIVRRVQAVRGVAPSITATLEAG